MNKSFSAQLYEPAIGTDTLLAIERASVARHLGYGVGMQLNYQHEPVVFSTQFLRSVGGNPIAGSDNEIPVVRNQMTTDITGVLGLRYGWLRAQVGLSLPLNLYIAGNEVDGEGRRAGDLSGTLLGDLKLQLKVVLFPRRKGFGLAFSPIITFPTGCAAADSCDDDGKFGGDSSVTFRPRLVADYELGPMIFAINVGYLVRKDVSAYSTTLGDQLLYGIGVGYEPHRRVRVIAELYGRAGLVGDDCVTYDQAVVCGEGTNIDRFPLEAGIGGQLRVMHGLHVSAGASFGVIKAIGTPQFRLLAGLRWAPDTRDRDSDGIADEADRCPTQPEDKDGFSDNDGCPDPDNDQDLIPDGQDKCPDAKEDEDNFQDSDGCPDNDNDKDGIKDASDQCPDKPETENGFKDDDGCPDVPDIDGDGIVDAQDSCPKKAEVVNGVDDTDGCPDEGPVTIDPARITLNERIKFSGKRIRRRSRELLSKLAVALSASPQIHGVRIMGVPRSKSKQQQQRWAARAEAVRVFLVVEQGVDANRLEAAVGEPATKGAIEFVITKRK